MTTLVVAAHPDDEVLGCGASIYKWATAGDDVHVLILAEGITSRDIKLESTASSAALDELAEAARVASRILTVSSLSLHDFPDNSMDTVRFLDIVKIVETFVSKLTPNVVVTHHVGDLNIDHRITHNAVLTACRPVPGCCVKRILCFETPSATEWQSPVFNQPFTPNWFEDVSRTFDVKLKALEAYEAEMRIWPHSRSIESVQNLARWRGASVGVEAAEAFMLIRQIVQE